MAPSTTPPPEAWGAVPDSFALSLYRSAFDTVPTPRSVSWSSLRTSLTTWRQLEEGADKRTLPAWSPASFGPGARRRLASRVVAVSCLVLDHDDGAPIEDGRRPWWAWSHLVHTTSSHTGEVPRYRVIVPLARPIPVAAWARAWHWAHHRAGLRADPKCKDPSRLYFLPAVRGNDSARFAAIHDAGAFLELRVEHLPPTPDEVAWAARRAAAEAKATEARTPRELADRLKTSEHARRTAAQLLGARVAGDGMSERAHGVTCPGCGQPSVWWPIVPRAVQKAMCSHRSCDWRGWLDQLLAHHGIALEAAW